MRFFTLTTFLILCTTIAVGQASSRYQRLGKLTTAEISAVDVSNTDYIYTAYDTDLSIEVINLGAGWIPRMNASSSVDWSNITNIPINLDTDSTDDFLLDGSRAMTGSIDMDGSNILNTTRQTFTTSGIADEINFVFSNESPTDNYFNISNGLGLLTNAFRMHIEDNQWEFSQLSGVGDRMVVANEDGRLTTQAIPGGGSADNLGNHVVTQDLLPDTQNTWDIGSSLLSFSQGYFRNVFSDEFDGYFRFARDATPASTGIGYSYFDTDDNNFYGHDGSSYRRFAFFDEIGGGGNLGIVASGSQDLTNIVGSNIATTITHGLGYSPDPSRISLELFRGNQQTTTSTQLVIGNITTTSFDVITSATGTDDLTLYWKIFGTGNVTPMTGSEIVSSIDTELGQTDWKTGGGSGTPDDDSVTTAKIVNGTILPEDIDLTQNYIWEGSQRFNQAITITKENSAQASISFFDDDGTTLRSLWGYDIFLDEVSLANTTSNNEIRLPDTGGVFIDTYLDLASNAITNLADPTNVQDAATKAYVDANSGVASDITGYGSGVTSTDNIVIWDYDVNSTEPTAGTGDTVLGKNIPPATSGTGTVLDLSDYFQYNFGAASSSATFTMDNMKDGGYAECLVNRADAPTVTGASLRPNGLTFIPNTDMILHVKDYDGTRKYWFTEF